MKKIILICMIACFLACNNHDSVREAKQENRTTESVMPVNKGDADFIVEATNGSLTEIEAAKLAVARAQSQQVKDYAGMMIEDHTQMLQDLNTLASSKNIVVPDSVSNSNKSRLDGLAKKSGSSFDKDYMEWMVDDHDEDVAKFTAMSKNANDESIKAFIKNALPVLLKHQQRAHTIYDSLK